MGQKLSRSFKKLGRKQPQVEENAPPLYEEHALPRHEEDVLPQQEEFVLPKEGEIALHLREESAPARQEEIAVPPYEENPLPPEPLLETPPQQQPLLEVPLPQQLFQEKPLLTNYVVKEREVKKANRELHNLTSKMDDLQKIETLQKRVTEHLADMKRLERDNLKNKKRGDTLQKEKDHARGELAKSVTLRDKLEKLCRELQRENNRLKVCLRMEPNTGRLNLEC
jgi:hypothetical protein